MECLRIYIFILVSFILIVSTRTYKMSIGNSISFMNTIPKQPEWLGTLRELIFKTISPYPSVNNDLYKSFLEAPFYGSSFSEMYDKEFVPSVLARGDVYYSYLKGSWIICQEGCINCTECLLQNGSSLKWILRRVSESFNSSRHELQLTIIPQLDDSFHMKNLHRQSYIYLVTPIKNTKLTMENDVNVKVNSELGRKRSIVVKTAFKPSGNFVEKNVTVNQDNELLSILLTNTSIPAKFLTNKQNRYPQKQQFLRVVPIQLKLNRNVDTESMKVSSRNFSSFLNQYNPITTNPFKNSKIVDRLSLIFNKQRRFDYNNLSTDLKNLYNAYENFFSKRQLENQKDFKSINSKNITFEKALPHQLKLKITRLNRKQTKAIIMNKSRNMKKVESPKKWKKRVTKKSIT